MAQPLRWHNVVFLFFVLVAIYLVANLTKEEEQSTPTENGSIVQMSASGGL